MSTRKPSKAPGPWASSASRFFDSLPRELYELRIKLDTRLTPELGIDSLAMMEAVIEIEERFSIVMPDFEEFDAGRIFTVEDLVDMVMERQADPKGDRVKITLSGKFLPFKYYGATGNAQAYGYKEE